MDDVPTGTETIEGAQRLKQTMVKIFGSGTFELHKWHSNLTSLETEHNNEGEDVLRETIAPTKRLNYKHFGTKIREEQRPIDDQLQHRRLQIETCHKEINAPHLGINI